MSMQKRTSSQSGAAALLTVLIVTAAGILLATNAAFLGLGEVDNAFVSGQAGETLSLADGCVDETMRRMRLDPNYGVGAGTMTLTMTDGSCDIDVVNTGGGARTITVSATHNAYHKNIEARVTIVGTSVTLDAWLEI